jgi:hypothetical protein
MDEEAWLMMALAQGWVHAHAGGSGDFDAWQEKAIEQGCKTADANMKKAAAGDVRCTYCDRGLRLGEKAFDGLIYPRPTKNTLPGRRGTSTEVVGSSALSASVPRNVR